MGHDNYKKIYRAFHKILNVLNYYITFFFKLFNYFKEMPNTDLSA